MKIEIRLLDTPHNESGRLLEIVEVAGGSYQNTQERVLSRMIHHAREHFGHNNYAPKVDASIFGGYYVNIDNDACIVAR